MDERKKMIVNEIKYWRENNLLPDTYCDFLLQLYTEGHEGVQDTKEKKRATFLIIDYLRPLTYSLFMLVMIALTFLVIYFTQFSNTLQIVVLSFVFVIAFVGSIYFHWKDMLIVHVYVISATFLSFILLLQIVQLVAPEQPLFLGFTIAALCSIWVYCGWRWKYQYLYIAGGTGILLFFSFLLL
ncbi:hypothetical protein [Evansella halocellulosilytica]|uniref:hypothetical protein n=1 Tax=Evansella halocellulosilytica TaxID=2011013 RepID=UPI000BB98554|nr:hypothetical protein [Evansella halocellulosilytica]